MSWELAETKPLKPLGFLPAPCDWCGEWRIALLPLQEEGGLVARCEGCWASFIYRGPADILIKEGV